MGFNASEMLGQISAACDDQLPLPPRGDEQVFTAPWQAQVFAMAVALNERGVFTWQEWAQTLGRHLVYGTLDGSDYYERWADALVNILEVHRIATATEIQRVTDAWHAAAARTPHGTPIELY